MRKKGHRWAQSGTAKTHHASRSPSSQLLGAWQKEILEAINTFGVG